MSSGTLEGDRTTRSIVCYFTEPLPEGDVRLTCDR
jgi:hypothetical protein